ncbi:hypothetical protein [Microbacterium hydrocarbonoxydans]|uniref:hypothetical protein n=1 Tax=Microbacterium hydrocarbonoxydans TaxID=273678 RepID=UPI0020413135|nr:hypothetical protein [Microbacterium hydrocarbonoxydans]MCM3778177.1 hypothetical protein [Microbacterium hydrocarbonoxydans]
MFELYRRGSIDSSDVVESELARLRIGDDLSRTEERIALLLSHELDQVEEILSELPDPYPLNDVERETLLLLRLSQIRTEWLSEADPPSLVEDALEDYGLDEKYGMLRLFAPLPRSEKSPEKYARRLDEAIEAGWSDLRAVAASRAARRPPGKDVMKHD